MKDAKQGNSMRYPKRPDAGVLGYPAYTHSRERLAMRRQFRTSLMSNTKWRKLFIAIERLKLELPICRIKWISEENLTTLRTPTSGTLYPPWPFVDSFEAGPFPLCSIQWLEFPRTALYSGPGRGAGTTYLQDVDRAEQALKVVARFPMENTPESLRIIGHVR